MIANTTREHVNEAWKRYLAAMTFEEMARKEFQRGRLKAAGRFGTEADFYFNEFATLTRGRQDLEDFIRRMYQKRERNQRIYALFS